jgi:hypothetical protein
MNDRKDDDADDAGDGDGHAERLRVLKWDALTRECMPTPKEAVWSGLNEQRSICRLKSRS